MLWDTVVLKDRSGFFFLPQCEINLLSVNVITGAGKTRGSVQYYRHVRPVTEPDRWEEPGDRPPVGTGTSAADRVLGTEGWERSREPGKNDIK